MDPTTPRPKFTPTLHTAQTSPSPALTSASTHWLPLLSCPADFPHELFEIALSQLIHHPEYNSTLILRSELVSEYTTSFPADIPHLDGHVPVKCIHRKLLPRRPGRDGPLEQYCTFYAPGSASALPTVLVLTPLIPPGGLPYYHPAVTHLAFHFLPAPTPLLRIEVIPLPDTPTDPNSRLARTALALLDTAHRYGWGATAGYTKRVQHDVLVPRETYQDFYLVMRERHKHLVGTWQEVTDPLKHVFEDIGIATYLMLLWKTTFTTSSTSDEVEDHEKEPWRAWPRSPGGFLDFGCGNGLLTHILISEGYSGHGIDLRARSSWSSYPPATQSQLHVVAVDPTESEKGESKYLHEGVFIISNHADELTPWTPVLARIHGASGYLSIPCCPWGFDAKFDRGQVGEFLLSPSLGEEDGEEEEEEEGLAGIEKEKSAYATYRLWLARLSAHCGYLVECDTLRIPSTRNWGVVGGKVNEEQAMENARGIVRHVRERGMFKTRVPEGKGVDH